MSNCTCFVTSLYRGNMWSQDSKFGSYTGAFVITGSLHWGYYLYKLLYFCQAQETLHYNGNFVISGFHCIKIKKPNKGSQKKIHNQQVKIHSDAYCMMISVFQLRQKDTAPCRLRQHTVVLFSTPSFFKHPVVFWPHYRNEICS